MRTPLKNNQGQVAIFFALIFTFMFVIFAFVIDFGHLINNKINLQIAADTAAYAGAAWQARIMNIMGAVNYRLRQDYKEIVMRTHVTHVRHNRNFPRGSTFVNGGDRLPNGGFYQFICQQAHGYQAISGLRYANDTNLCRNASPETGGLPPIVVPPVVAQFDPFAHAIAAQIRQIQQAANKECRAAAQDNRRLAEYLKREYESRTEFHVQQMRALETFLNAVNQEARNLGRNNLGKSPIAQTAVQTALNNLSNSNKDEFRLEIMQPETKEYIKLEDPRTDASLMFYDFNVAGDGCVAQPGLLNDVRLSPGMSKDNTIITYFAVKLSAKPKMLFMPQAWTEAAFPTIEAFAAAKPFGGRIGPQAAADQRIPFPATRPGNVSRELNFSMRPNDQLGIMNAKLLAFYDALHRFNSFGRPDGNQNTGWPDPAKSGDSLLLPLQASRAPTLFDAAFFTIFPDPNEARDYFEPQFAEVLYPDYLEAAGPNNQIIPTQNPKTAAYFPPEVGSQNRGTGWVQINATPETIGSPYDFYAKEDLATHSIVGASALPIISGKEQEFGFADRNAIHSGWAPFDNANGRIGYSVKFVSMNALLKTLQVNLPDGGQGTINNRPTGDENLQFIKH